VGKIERKTRNSSALTCDSLSNLVERLW
jgi:hypothetical protein